MSSLINTKTPTLYEIHSGASAPGTAGQTLEAVSQNLGFVPNLMGVFAGAPSALNAYLQLGDTFGATSLTPTEQNVVLLAVSVANQCEYCVAAHSAISKMAGVPDPVIEAVRTGRPIEDARIQSLRALVQDVTARRGHPDRDVLDRFFAHGYSRQNALEVVLGVTMKTLSNYTNHLAETPLDERFRPFAWTP
jgi:AhpD family alkylhydroperoxidase